MLRFWILFWDNKNENKSLICMGEKLRVGFYVGILLSEIVFISVGIALYITGRNDFIQKLLDCNHSRKINGS